MTDIFTLGLKADTTDIDKGAKSLDDIAKSAEGADKKTGQMREGINSTGKAVAAFGLVAVSAFTGITVAAGNTAREITNLSRLTNQSVEDFQRTAFAARAYGIEQDKLGDILKDVQDKVGDFITTGAGPMVDFFEKIAPQVGITADNFRNLNGKDALQLYVSSIEKANVSQSEMIFFMEAIASDATLLQPLLANSGAEFLRLAERADELGVVLDQLDVTNLNDMKTSLSELSAISEATSNVIGATLAPFVKDLVDQFNDASVSADTLREGMTTLVESGVTVAGVYADAGRVFEIFGKAIGATAFTLVESFNTMDARLDQLGVSFELTFDELQLSLIEWVNEQDAELARWSSSVINAADVFDVFDDITIEPQPLDTSELEASISMLKEQAAGLEMDLITSNENIANAWQDVIDTMLQPLPSEGMDKWVAGIIKGVEAQRELQKEIKKTGDGNNKIVKTAGSDAVKWISNTKEVTKGLGAAFGENEKIAKSLHQVNQVIGIAEQAMILQKVFADNAATQTHIANSTAKATANAVEAVTAAAAAPFPVGFASAAAMIGLMASVLGSFSGGGGSVDLTEQRQEQQGTGSLLGSDAKSQSILDAQERFEDISIDQLSELRGIRNGIDAIAGGVSLLARNFIASGGLGEFGGDLSGSKFSEEGIGKIFGTNSPLGKISGLGGKLVDSLFGSSKKKVTDTGIQFISQTLGDILEGGVIEASQFFDVETTKKKLFGLSKKVSTSTEFQDLDASFGEGIGDIFKNIGDVVLQSADLLGFETVSMITSSFSGLGPSDFDNITDFREAMLGGLGTVFTETEVGLEEALAGFQIDIGKVSLEGLSGEEVEQELQAIFSQQADLIAEFLVPSIAEYQKIGEGLFDTLTRVTVEQAIFNDSIAQMGISLSDLSNVMQIDIAQSIIDLIGGAERFNDLTGEFFSEFFTEAEQFEQLTGSLTGAVEGLGLSMFDSREGFRAMVEGLDLTTDAGQAMFAALLELSPAMAEYFDTLESNAAELAAEAEQELEDARRAATEATREAADAARELERAASSAFSELSKAVRTEQNALKNLLKDDVSEIRNNFDAHRNALKEQLEGNMESIESVFEGRRAAAQSRMEQQIGSMERQLDIANGQMSALSSLSSLLGGAISQVAALSRSQAKGIIQDAIAVAKAGGSLAGQDLSGAVSSITNIDAKEFGSALELQKERARTANALGELKDLTDGQLSIAERSVEMLERQIESIERSGESQIEALNLAQEVEEAAERARFDEEIALADQRQQAEEDAAQGRFDEQTGLLDEQLENAREQLDALLGIDTSVKSLAEATSAFAQAVQNINDNIAAAVVVATTSPAVPVTPATQGGNNVTASDRVEDFSSKDIMKSIAISSAKTAKLLDRWDGDGQPDIRDVS